MTIFTHSHPLWRARSNYIAQAQVESDVEQMWVEKRSSSLAMLCCIPYFTYGYALGDLVEMDSNGVLGRLVSPSGRRSARIWFGESSAPDQDNQLRLLVDAGAGLERHSVNLVAVDFASDSAVDEVLVSGHNSGHFILEYGN